MTFKIQVCLWMAEIWVKLGDVEPEPLHILDSFSEKCFTFVSWQHLTGLPYVLQVNWLIGVDEEHFGLFNRGILNLNSIPGATIHKITMSHITIFYHSVATLMMLMYMILFATDIDASHDQGLYERSNIYSCRKYENITITGGNAACAILCRSRRVQGCPDSCRSFMTPDSSTCDLCFDCPSQHEGYHLLSGPGYIESVDQQLNQGRLNIPSHAGASETQAHYMSSSGRGTSRPAAIVREECGRCMRVKHDMRFLWWQPVCSFVYYMKYPKYVNLIPNMNH